MYNIGELMERLLSLIETRREISLRTKLEYPPIPINRFDWAAWDDKTYDLGQPCGYGPTEVEAINNLIEELEE